MRGLAEDEVISTGSTYFGGRTITMRYRLNARTEEERRVKS